MEAAPSERVFSTAGLTISKDRARLASQTANELIFYMMFVLQLQSLRELHELNRFWSFPRWIRIHGFTEYMPVARHPPIL